MVPGAIAKSRPAFLDHPGPIPFAHQGGTSDAPGNTMPAFQAAIDLGYRYVETDVHATADGVLVAFHDADLDHGTDGTGRIRELPWVRVKAARVAGTEPIPLLEDLLGTWPDLRVNIDPKHESACDLLAATLQRCDAVERVCVGAFSDKRVARVKTLCGPGLCTALGPRGVASLVAASKGIGRFRSDADAAQVPHRQSGLPVITKGFVDTAHHHGIVVHAWTIDDPDEMAELLDLGVDGIMTDEPAVLREVLERRGLWA